MWNARNITVITVDVGIDASLEYLQTNDIIGKCYSFKFGANAIKEVVCIAKAFLGNITTIHCHNHIVWSYFITFFDDLACT